MNAGLIDEFSIALSPVLLGSGTRLFEGVDADRVALEQLRAEPTQRVSHLTYAVRDGRAAVDDHDRSPGRHRAGRSRPSQPGARGVEELGSGELVLILLVALTVGGLLLIIRGGYDLLV